MIFELVWFEMARFLVDNVPGELKHLFRDLHVLNVVEILGVCAHLVGIAKQHAHQPLIAGFQSDDVLPVGQDNASESDFIERADGFTDDGIGIMPNLAIGDNVIRPHQIKVVDFLARNELVDVNRASGLERDIVEFVLADFQISVSINLVAFDDVVVRDFFARRSCNP